MSEAVPAHWIRPNHRTSVPKDLVYIAMETTEVRKGATTRQRFQAGAAIHCWAGGGRGQTPGEERARFGSTKELWIFVDRCATKRRRCVVVAHDLSAVLQTGDGLHGFRQLGWKVKRLRFETGHAWAAWSNDGRSLVMCDLQSWIPKGFQRIRNLAGTGIRPSVGQDDEQTSPGHQASRDCQAIASVYGEILAWIESEGLGDWKATGAGQAWAAWRHRFMTHRVLVHDNLELRQLERRSCYAGRGEAYRIGGPWRGRFHEWDTTTAYARICRDCAVPVRLLGEVRRPTVKAALCPPEGRCVLSQAEVATEVPTLPWSDSGGICWPVGSFTGVWWDHELAQAVADGAVVRPVRSWLYQAEPALRSWAEWLLDVMEGRAACSSPTIAMATKHWSRALVGRFAAQWSTWERLGENITGDVFLSVSSRYDRPGTYKSLHLDSGLFEEAGRVDAADCAPQVMSWVMAECRLRLWRALNYVGLEHVVHCDTDGFICDSAGDERMRSYGVDGWRRKAEWHRLVVVGSRRIMGDVERRLPGVPSSAAQSGERAFVGEVRRGLGHALASPGSGAVRSKDRHWVVTGSERRRAVFAGGRTGPVRVESDRRVTP